MINKVTLIGRLGSDPELRSTESGLKVCNVSLATSENWTKSGERQERTEWHRLVFFDRLAEIVEQYLHKGSLIFVEGRLQTRKWDDRDGNARYTTEVIAREMKMLDSKGQRQGTDAQDSPSQTQNYSQSAPQRMAKKPAQQDEHHEEALDDRLPF